MLPTYSLLADSIDGSVVDTEVSSATALSLLGFKATGNLRVNFKEIICCLRDRKLSSERWVVEVFVGFCKKLVNNKDDDEDVEAIIANSYRNLGVLSWERGSWKMAGLSLYPFAI